MRPLIATTPDIAHWITPRATVAHCKLPAWEEGVYASLSNGSSIGLSLTSQRCVVEIGGRAFDRRVPAAGVVIVGSEPTRWLRVDEPSEIIEVTADPALRRSVAEELYVPGASDLASISLDNDPRVWAIGMQLCALVRGERSGNELEIDALTRVLYGHVLVRAFGGRSRARGSGVLDNRRLRRVIDHIEAHLEDAMGLAVLAEVAALSPFHFQRSFVRATGCTPHRYVAVRRAQRAAQWLKEGRPVREVAKVLRYGSTARLRLALLRVDHPWPPSSSQSQRSP